MQQLSFLVKRGRMTYLRRIDAPVCLTEIITETLQKYFHVESEKYLDNNIVLIQYVPITTLLTKNLEVNHEYHIR